MGRKKSHGLIIYNLRHLINKYIMQLISRNGRYDDGVNLLKRSTVLCSWFQEKNKTIRNQLIHNAIHFMLGKITGLGIC